MCRRDYVDYAVAPCWQDHYASVGLTYPTSPRQERARNHANDVETAEHIERLATENAQIRRELVELRRALETFRKEGTPAGTSGQRRGISLE